MELLTTPTLVESPFIIVKIGDYTFGAYKGSRRSAGEGFSSELNVTYPNYMDSINITKVNGAVNTYTIKMVYGITQDSDPNLLEKVFGSIADSWKITISYGDWNSPSFIYKEESAIITKILSNIDFASNKITYTLNCTSDSLQLISDIRDFPARKNKKPSDVIKELLYDRSYNLLDIFKGMKKESLVKSANLIDSSDKRVDIPAVKSVNVLTYINYLVNSMIPIEDTDPNQQIGTAKYYLTIVDDTKNKFGGAYFKVSKVGTAVGAIQSYDTYTVDIGYPGNDLVTGFNLKDDNSYAILYKYSGEVAQTNYINRIDNDGNMTTEFSPAITRNKTIMQPTAANKSWWTQLTQFPISATLTIKGLLRPAMLMSYVRVNSVFYGNKHSSSGLYIITKQEDSISASSGYRTTLTLQRIGGDE